MTAVKKSGSDDLTKYSIAVELDRLRRRLIILVECETGRCANYDFHLTAAEAGRPSRNQPSFHRQVTLRQPYPNPVYDNGLEPALRTTETNSAHPFASAQMRKAKHAEMA